MQSVQHGHGQRCVMCEGIPCVLHCWKRVTRILKGSMRTGMARDTPWFEGTLCVLHCCKSRHRYREGQRAHWKLMHGRSMSGCSRSGCLTSGCLMRHGRLMRHERSASAPQRQNLRNQTVCMSTNPTLHSYTPSKDC